MPSWREWKGRCIAGIPGRVEYEDVWDLRNAGDLLESGSGNKPYTNSHTSYGKNQEVNEV